LLLICSPAYADGVSTRANQLRSSSEYKVRLSAALWLGKKNDSRAIAALTYAVRKDSASTVRSVAALSLSKLIDEAVPKRVRDKAIDALAYVAKHDSDKKVRKKARDAWTKTKALRSPKGGLPKVFVAVGTPTGAKRLATKAVVAAMQKSMRRALRESAPNFGQATKKDGLPTQKELRSARSAGFYVNASVQEIQTIKKRGYTEVRCKVGMRVNVWNGKDGEERLLENETAAATGNGRVKGANTKRAVANARRDCINAVVEQLTTRQVVPFIKRAVDKRVALSDE
jgi:hypothetical protein